MDPLPPDAFADPAFVTTHDCAFAHVAVGPADGPLALVVHGFPDHPYTWRHHLPVLADLGYRAVAVWTRGYAPSQVPAGRTVSIDVLARDLDRLHDALGGDGRAVLVGHDWGAVAAWRAAARSPRRWSRLVALAVPPLQVLAGLRREPTQLARLWYQFAFQVPGVEATLGPAWVRGLWRAWGSGEPSPEHLGLVGDMLASPGCARAVLGYYRGLLDGFLSGRFPSRHEPLPSQPTLYLHGRDDGCFLPRYADRTRGRLAPGSNVQVLPRAGHFVHLDAPDAVTAALRRFLAPSG